MARAAQSARTTPQAPPRLVDQTLGISTGRGILGSEGKQDSDSPGGPERVMTVGVTTLPSANFWPRHKAFAPGAPTAGWRCDYFITSESLRPRLADSFYQRHVRGSDHCPHTLLVLQQGAGAAESQCP